MISISNVNGSSEQAQPLVKGIDTIYVHTNIKQINTDPNNPLYSYDEVQYTYDEYNNSLSELKQQLADGDYKIVKLYEYSLVGATTTEYNIKSLHTDRENIRQQIRTLEGKTE